MSNSKTFLMIGASFIFHLLLSIHICETQACLCQSLGSHFAHGQQPPGCYPPFPRTIKEDSNQSGGD